MTKYFIHKKTMETRTYSMVIHLSKTINHYCERKLFFYYYFKLK